jgi:YHS domain-containing protein
MRFPRFASLVVVAALAAVSPSQAEDSAAPAVAPALSVVPVEHSRVCMMNDRVFNRPMIPIEVAGKTYFGCCEMCQEKLGQHAELRASKDPVSGKTVDKATAVAGALPNGRVLYFEDRANLEALSEQLRAESERAVR